MAKILLVDDDENLTDLLQEILANNGHQVDAAHDGKEGLAKAKLTKYDLMILDMHMPQLGGIDVLKVLRNSPDLKSLPVLMCTSESVTKEIDVAFSAGANGYILKPYNIERLIAKVNSALQPKK